MDKKTWGILIIGLIVGFIAGGIAAQQGLVFAPVDGGDGTATTTDDGVTVKDDEEEGTSSGSVSIGTVTDSGNAIEVVAQPAGSKVAVTLAVFAKPGWVVIHEDMAGKPGNILGALWLPAGESRGVSVDLLRPTLTGKSYYAMLHSDNGDKLFDKSKDLPITDSTGATIMRSFSTTPQTSA